MTQKRVAILLGAGAVLDWGAPKTLCDNAELTFIPDHGTHEMSNRVCCLTHLIRATGFKDQSGSRMTNNIFQDLKLKDSGNVNFETIINIIEDLYNYWSTEENKTSKNLFALARLEDKINKYYYFSHSIKESGSDYYSISIPNVDMLQDVNVSSKINPIQKYYELLLDDILGGIIGHISKYSYYTSSFDVIFQDHNSLINNNFYLWANKFLEKGYIWRMYTLNYDRLFKNILQLNGIDIFEGFDIPNSDITPGEEIAPNLHRIMTDYNSNAFYNLHGSAYWTVKDLNCNNLPGYQYFLSGIPGLNDRAAIIEIETGRKLLLANIITGYQKAQKTAISPFRQMLSAFDRDCLEANILYVVGYSFGDEHINDIIRNARKYNTTLEIVLINPSFNDEQFMFDFILHWGTPKGTIYKNISNNEIICPDYQVRIIKKTFGDFLSDDRKS